MHASVGDGIIDTGTNRHSARMRSHMTYALALHMLYLFPLDWRAALINTTSKKDTCV